MRVPHDFCFNVEIEISRGFANGPMRLFQMTLNARASERLELLRRLASFEERQQSSGDSIVTVEPPPVPR
jgi:hypothetical protein